MKLFSLTLLLLLLCNTSFSQIKKTPAITLQKDENKAHFSMDDKKNQPKMIGSFLAFTFSNDVIPMKSWEDLSGNEKNIRAIIIQKQTLSNYPKELTALTNIESIDLSFNNLTSVDESFFKHFPKLKKLYLNNNPIPLEMLERFVEKNPTIQVFYLPEHFTK